MIEQERIHHLKSGKPLPGRFVLYWMQQAQRTHDNHALEYAIAKANELQLPLVTCFVCTGDFPEANLRHYHFMLEGLRELAPELQKRNVQFVVRVGEIPREIAILAREAALLIGDMGYLRIQRAWREEVVEAVACPVVMVETDVIVPVETASSKEEIAARTLRPKLHKQSERFLLAPFGEGHCQYGDISFPLQGSDFMGQSLVPDDICTDRRVSPVQHFRGGQAEAQQLLTRFIEGKLGSYHSSSNDPSKECLSRLSPYLHFGQISPLDIARKVQSSDVCREAKDAFLEQLIVRRELSMNFVWYHPDYDRYESAVPEWAQRNLAEHQHDERPYLYTFSQLQQAETHDIYWNAAQQEMIITGHMHNYMRMYWAKKIIEWSERPEEAFYTMLTLNNRYELDGRDPNAFAGIAWCFGRFDHPWKEREIFGKIRYMNDRGLKRKFDISLYVERINALL